MAQRIKLVFNLKDAGSNPLTDEGPGREILKRPSSVHPSVRPSRLVFTLLKTHCCIFSKLCWYVHHVMGVCCIVFDIDGMFELFMNSFLI